MSERWMPEYGETYYFVDSLGHVSSYTWEGDSVDCECYEFGNCFKTEAEAKATAEKVKALLLSLREEQPVTDSNRLPKLTAEVFDRPDCPEWAKYAVVNMHGIGYFYENEPSYGTENYKGMWYVDTGKICIMQDAIFDSSDWQNSLIERPTKSAFEKMLKNCAEQQANKILQKAREHRLPEQYGNAPEETKLPDWCKVGEWVYCTQTNNYGKILSVDKEKVNICIPPDETFYAKTNMMLKYGRTARLRPYNAEEMKALMGKVIEEGPSMDIVTGFENVFDNECMVHVNGCLYGANDLLRRFTIDGQPCGKLVHKEGDDWVE